MSLFTEKERADLCYMHDNNPGALFDATYGGYDDYCTLGTCINGNLFDQAPYRPLWSVRKPTESEN